MHRFWLALLCAVLVVWVPLGFAVEAASSIGSLGMRGLPAAIELVVHGLAAAVAVAAGRALWIDGPGAGVLAVTALVLYALIGVQSLYWTALPRQTKPGDELPLAVLTIAHAGGWIVYLSRRRARESY